MINTHHKNNLSNIPPQYVMDNNLSSSRSNMSKPKPTETRY